MADAPLLPSNSTPLERQAAQALAQIQRVPIPLRTLYNPDLCPLPLLPYLAWAFSVDRWDSKWTEAAKRAAIRSAYYIHSRKGTIGSLRRVVEPLGYLIEIIEWWQTVPVGPRATFRLKVGVLDTGITEEMYQELTWLIDDARPLTRHLTGLAISLETTGSVHIGACITEGDEIDIYPPTQRDIEVTGYIHQGGREHQIDTMDIYP
ncbi:phage tail protein I [Pseudomonas thivervalensis]|uniref:Phage tail protein I n=1 Tax=Pseudomonas thivervalensis TaxID=86265 RepID=A0A2Z4ZKC7_9PSED|nr:phage tail protein I [Pseudomonas thivervalensis]AXA58399.1 phage tail protein I [Pseudomonas thivervalensis]AXA60403.1 phage tail protein I [Pseudomonas thivervalensis]